MKGELRVCAHNNHPKQHSDSRRPARDPTIHFRFHKAGRVFKHLPSVCKTPPSICKNNCQQSFSCTIAQEQNMQKHVNVAYIEFYEFSRLENK